MKHLQLMFAGSVIVIIHLISPASSIRISNDLSLTRIQKQSLDKFKTRVVPKLEQPYMKEDIYLIRWLRARNFDVGRAEEMLMTNLKWRRENKMDMVQGEDWSAFENEVPYYLLEGRENKPIIVFPIGLWDIRKVAISGQINKLVRYFAKAMDQAALKVLELQREGRNITRWVSIFDMDKLNAEQHLTAQCLPFYTNSVLLYDNNFPNLADEIVLINTPGIFEVVLTLTRPLMSSDTRKALKVYGKNRAQWESELSYWVDPAKLPL